jgi:hypothetical protein
MGAFFAHLGKLIRPVKFQAPEIEQLSLGLPGYAANFFLIPLNSKFALLPDQC